MAATLHPSRTRYKSPSRAVPQVTTSRPRRVGDAWPIGVSDPGRTTVRPLPGTTVYDFGQVKEIQTDNYRAWVADNEWRTMAQAQAAGFAIISNGEEIPVEGGAMDDWYQKEAVKQIERCATACRAGLKIALKVESQKKKPKPRKWRIQRQRMAGKKT